MRFTDLQYQSKVLNRLANMVSHKGLSEMKKSLDKAMERIWSELESYYSSQLTSKRS